MVEHVGTHQGHIPGLGYDGGVQEMFELLETSLDKNNARNSQKLCLKNSKKI
jgi:hypothetical protein